MAKCKSCGTDIQDGAEYCADCLSKLNTAKTSESYLDSLLSAVMTEEPERREIVFPKREASSLVSVPEDREYEVKEDAPASETDLLQVFEGVQEDASEPEEEPPMEDVFGTFFDRDTELPDLKNYSIFGDVDEGTVDRMLAEDLAELGFGEEETEEPREFTDEEETIAEETDIFADFAAFEEPQANLFEEASEEEEEVAAAEVGDIADLFGMLEDERGEDAPEDIEMAEPPVISAEELDAAADTFSGIVEASEEDVPANEFGDIADLFGGMEAVQDDSSEEPIAAFGDFADLFAEGDVVQDETPAPSAAVSDTMDDFADLFGDGMFEFGAEPEELIPEDGEPVASAAATVSETTESKAESFDKKEKKGKGRLAALYHKLFDNVKVDPSKIKQPPTKEELEAKKKAKQDAKERSKEEKEAQLAEKKAQEKQEKLEKQRIKKEAKAEKKAKKMEEAKLLLEEMEKTRINRAGASIVFIFFAMIAVVIIVGTSIFSYSLSIKNAEIEFERDEYTAAYNEIYGLEIKQEDILLYDRIMTVMYVQKQLNSYNNYYEMNDMPKALDSLLKGLQRYEKYIDLAVKLEVDTDLDDVRKKILEKVTSGFMLTEQEAMEIIQSDSQAEYSKKVYDAVDALQ
ncbi:MAG: hypothetical protein IJ427_10355 [Lachnospiraceae bacterium]|nr:hypothetical protein [Lachnospiraceae bacterium]MBQ8548883.1 hypothetical protein [Lachnospiraceae bacterium]MBQ8845875.1 hypothetical protein [Lachnospiraceae bacterium]